MWIGKAVAAMLAVGNEQLREAERGAVGYMGENTRLKEENARLVAMNGWLMHRLTQVEHERGMLMQDRLGIKITVPAFVPAMDNPAEALQQMVDVSTVGGDAADSDADAAQNPGIDYSMMPGYRGK